MNSCLQCKTGFEITEKDRQLLDKLNMPESRICPDCRLQNKLTFRNERYLYQDVCALRGKKFLSIYRKNAGYTVYSQDIWWSDKWDPIWCGQDFDFTRPFFEQFDELFRKVPKYNTYNVDNENSDYCNIVSHNKNCYLLFGSWFNENCFYGNTILHSDMNFDSLFAERCNYCYELVDCSHCYELFFSQLCDNCSNSWFLYNCRNCSNCIGCANLINKENYIFNKPATREEVNGITKSINGSKINELKDAFEKIRVKAIRKFITGINNQSVTGDFIYNSKNIKDSYVIYDSEDIIYSFRVTKHQKDSMYIMGCSGGELVYDSLNADFCHRSGFLINGEHNSDSFYCTNCYNLVNCFGCDGLRHKKYCILNKQYTKEDYEKLLPKIAEHMKLTGEYGEFFPANISPFAYNETAAQDYYPLTKDEVQKRGWLWLDKKDNIPKVAKTIPASKLPDDIKDIPDDILNWAIECGVSKKPFRIIPQELKFYRKYNLPIPKFHPDERYLNRMRLRNPMKLYDRKCTNCASPIRTTYSPDRPEKVYCEECYLKDVY